MVRGVFLLICGGIGILLGQRLEEVDAPAFGWMVPACIAVGLCVIGVEVLFARSSIQTISALVFGLLVGFALSALFSPVIEVIVERFVAHVEDETNAGDAAAEIRQVKFLMQLVVTVLFCYFGITLLLQTQGQFKFLIPYVEFRSEVKGLRPVLVDTSVILEGQLGPLAETGFFESRLVVPSFVASEIQRLADSGDARKRQVGERGLAILKSLVTEERVEIVSYEEDGVGAVDETLLLVARRESARILTRDAKLDRRAALEGVPTIFLPRVIGAIRPSEQVGDRVDLEIVRKGEQDHQGVGYLPDGTLVVVDQASDAIGSTQAVEIRRVVPTQSGRMLFARRCEALSREG